MHRQVWVGHGGTRCVSDRTVPKGAGRRLRREYPFAEKKNHARASSIFFFTVGVPHRRPLSKKNVRYLKTILSVVPVRDSCATSRIECNVSTIFFVCEDTRK